MQEFKNLPLNKEKILSEINANGPSFPGRIASRVGITTLFASAILSELVSERKLKVSNMRVGSSPVYLIPGQESLLEKFSEHLNQKEKEALIMLKEAKTLEDEKLSPQMRVALRSIKDFAIPITININDKENIYWRYITISEEEARGLVESKSSDKKIMRKEKDISDKPLEKTPKKERKPIPLSRSLKEYLESKEIEILEEKVSKKETELKIRLDSKFGKQDYLAIYKDKKKITEEDILISLHKANAEKMPALILSKGNLDKKAQETLQKWSNLVKFEKLEP